MYHRVKDPGNQASFMTKELNKQIMNRSKSENFKWPSWKTSWPIKTKKNHKCNNMTKYGKRAYLQKVREKTVINTAHKKSFPLRISSVNFFRP